MKAIDGTLLLFAFSGEKCDACGSHRRPFYWHEGQSLCRPCAAQLQNVIKKLSPKDDSRSEGFD